MSVRMIITFLGIFLVSFNPMLIKAQPGINTDMNEYYEYVTILKNFESAWIKEDFELVRAHKDSLIDMMQIEISQNEKKLIDSTKSEAQPVKEYDRRDALRLDNELKSPGLFNDSDEMQELQTLRSILNKQIEILTAAETYHFSNVKTTDPEAVIIKDMISQFAVTMQREIEISR
jgi:hypothetical protein